MLPSQAALKVYLCMLDCPSGIMPGGVHYLGFSCQWKQQTKYKYQLGLLWREIWPLSYPRHCWAIRAKLGMWQEFWGKYGCKHRSLSYSCCSGEEMGGCFMAVTLGLAGRDFSRSAAMLSVVLEHGFNIKYREQARYHLVVETWFTPSSDSSSQCSTENSSCWFPSEMLNWGHLHSSKKCFIFLS